jgi:Na+-transporting NADH:ubiquinone oxidoreductase subunit NqrE
MLTSILAHPFAKEAVVKAQKVITYAQAAHQVTAKMRALGQVLGICRVLASTTKTRMTSVGLALDSLLVNREVFEALTRRYSYLIKQAAVLEILDDPDVWAAWERLYNLLLPICKVIMALQAGNTNLADVTRCVQGATTTRC